MSIKKKMKTVAVIGTRGFPGIQGGVEAHSYHLYTRMSDVNVRLYRRRAYLTPQSSQAFPNIEYIDLPSTRVKGFEAVWHTLLSVLHIAFHRPDVVHIHNIGPGMFAPLLRLMGVPAEIYDMAVLYMRVYLTGMPVILLYNFESAIFRSQGDTRTPLMCLTISGLVNVALNVFFVVVVGMTVNGVALATVISNLISSSLLFYFLCRTDSAVHVDFRELKIHTDVLGHMLQIGVPAGLQSMVFSLANICVQSAINSLGADVVAGSSAAFNIEIFSYFLLNSFGQACTTFVGQNYGAGKPERCRRTLRLCLIQDLAVVAAAAALILTFGTQILGIFNTDPAVAEFGMIRMRYILIAHLFSVIVEVVSGAMRGYGFSAWPALMSLFGICGIRITWVYTVFRATPTFATLMLVYPVSIAATAAAVTISYMYLQRTRLQRMEI